jgi:peptide/nickel transport system substrate-binding protein
MRGKNRVARSSKWRLGAVAAILCLPIGSAMAAGDRVTIVMDPPSVETNRFWQTIGDFGLDPSLQRLVGNDPLTGVYNNDGLAERWEASEDFKTWTFYLEPEAEWHFDWGPVTAADVLHSYELHTAPDVTLTGIEQLEADRVEVIDDHTIAFHFERARTDFAFPLAGRGSMYVYSKAQYDAEGLDGYDRRPAGSGPYQYVERRVGEGVLFERAPDHWSGVRPDFPELHIRFATEPATMLAMLVAGEVDMATLPREMTPQALEAGMEIIESQNAAMQTVMIMYGLYQTSGDPAHRPDLPWANVKVREAMNRAIDRETLIDVLYDGRADILPRYNMHAPHEGFEPALVERFEEMYGFDPDRARELLEEAGYPDAFPDPIIPIVSTTLAGNPEFPTMAELLQVFFEDIGLQTELREMDYASLGALGRGRQAYVVSPVRNAPIRPSELGLRNTFTPQGSYFHGYEDDTIVAMIDEISQTIEPEERDRLIRAAFTYVFEQYTDLPMASVNAEVTVNPDVVGGWVYPGVTSFGLSHWHLIERAADG